MAEKRTIKRGTLYLNQRQLKAWRQVVEIAHEQGRSEAEAQQLIADACRMAVEQHIGKTGG